MASVRIPNDGDVTAASTIVADNIVTGDDGAKGVKDSTVAITAISDAQATADAALPKSGGTMTGALAVEQAVATEGIDVVATGDGRTTTIAGAGVEFDGASTAVGGYSIACSDAAASQPGKILTVGSGNATGPGDVDGGDLILVAGAEANAGTAGKIQVGLASTQTSAVEVGATGVPTTVLDDLTVTGTTTHTTKLAVDQLAPGTDTYVLKTVGTTPTWSVDTGGGGQTDTVQGDDVGLQNTGTDTDAVLAPIFGTTTGTVAEGDDARLDPFTTIQDGLVPASGASTALYLQGDGTWSDPSAGSGHGTTNSIDDHGDVDIVTDPVQEGEVLVWRTDEFVPEPQTGGGDVTAAATLTNDALVIGGDPGTKGVASSTITETEVQAAVDYEAVGHLELGGGAMTGPITTNSTFDGIDVGVDVAANTAKLTADTTNVAAAGALMLTGGAMTGAITTNSTFDGVDVGGHAGDATLHFTEASIDHTAITNIGTNTHEQIDTAITASSDHIADVDATDTGNPHDVSLDNIVQGTITHLNEAVGDADFGGALVGDIPMYAANTMFEGATDIGTPALVDRIPIQDDTDDSIKYVQITNLPSGSETNDLATDGVLGIADNEIAVGTGAGTAAYAALNTNGAVSFNGTAFAQANLADLGDVTTPTGTGEPVLAISPVITGTPTVSDLTNIQHDHSDAANGGGLGTGVVDTAQLAADAVETAKILNDNVTYAKMQNVVADNVLLGNNSGAGGVVDELTGTEATALLDLATTGLKGLAPVLSNVSTEYLDGTGAYSTPAGGTASGTLGQFNYDDVTADADPGAGNIRFDTADITTASEVYISDSNANGLSLVNVLTAMTAGSHLRLERPDDPTQSALLHFLSVTDLTGYVRLNNVDLVFPTVVSTAGFTFPTDGEPLNITLIPFLENAYALGGDLTGSGSSIGNINATIATDAVEESMILDGAVTQSKIGTNAVDITRIDPTGGSTTDLLGLDGSGDPAWLTQASLVLGGAQITSGTIDANRIPSNAVTQHEGDINHDNLTGSLPKEHVPITENVEASRPAASTLSGEQHLSTDTGVLERSDGSNWNPITGVKCNFDASAAPVGATDDVTLFYSVGSRWFDTTNDKEYVCLDNSDGAAVWTETTGGGGGGPTTPGTTVVPEVVVWDATDGSAIGRTGFLMHAASAGTGTRDLGTSDIGALAGGKIVTDGTIEATDDGAVAMGFVSQASTGACKISATADGAVALGAASSTDTNTSTVEATGAGALAVGEASYGTVSSQGAGSLAVGTVATGGTSTLR